MQTRLNLECLRKEVFKNEKFWLGQLNKSQFQTFVELSSLTIWG